jgi:hypothetical protein
LLVLLLISLSSASPAANNVRVNYLLDEPIFVDQFPYYVWGFPVRNLGGYNGGLNLMSNHSTVSKPALIPLLLQKKPAGAVPVPAAEDTYDEAPAYKRSAEANDVPVFNRY